MLKNRLTWLVPVGLAMLAAGLVLRNFVHFRYSEFTSGFLIGMSLVFMIAGFVQRSMGIPG